MRTLILFLFLSIATFSCKDDNPAGPNVCNTEDPTSMPWLKAKIMQYKNKNDEKETYLNQGEIKEKYGSGYLFWFSSCCTICTPMEIKYYNCDGEQVTLPPTVGFESPFVDTKVIWTGRNSTCLFM
jgi:hypothetical protein